MSKVYFDLGSENYPRWWELWENEVVCCENGKSDFECYKHCEPFNCRRADWLYQFMWTRKR